MFIENCTGVIHGENNYNVSFFNSGFRFSFLNPGNDIDCVLKPCSGYLWGNTFSHQQIAIPYNASIPVAAEISYSPNHFLLSSSIGGRIDPDGFSQIVFKNGSLNKVFIPSAIKITNNENGFFVKLDDDSIACSFFINDEKCSMKIYSETSRSRDKSGGFTISNTDVYLTLTFDSIQPYSSLVKHYKAIKRLLAFLIFRENAGFEQIEIIPCSEHIQNGYSSSYLFVYDDSARILSEKDSFNCIHFSDIQNQLGSLVTLLYSNNSSKPTWSLGFFPKSDDYADLISEFEIRALFAGLECELHHAKIHLPCHPKITELRDYLIEQIDIFDKNHSEYKKDLQTVYGRVKSNLRGLSDNLSARIKALFHSFDPEMKIILSNCHLEKDIDENIDLLCRYRNRVTHGNNEPLSGDLATTAMVLIGLVYCSILKRIGLDDTEIVKLCKWKIAN